MITQGLFTSTTDEWATPQDFFDQLDQEFHFKLDVCANDENHKCAKYFTKADDGLNMDWGGMLFGATHLMAERLANGWQNVPITKELLLCSCRHEQIRGGFMITYTATQKLDLSKDGSSLVVVRTQRRSHQW